MIEEILYQVPGFPRSGEHFQGGVIVVGIAFLLLSGITACMYRKEISKYVKDEVSKGMKYVGRLSRR